MIITRNPFTVADVLGTLADVDLERRNPGVEDGDTCLYATALEPANGPSCLVGTIVYKLDKPMFDAVIGASGAAWYGVAAFIHANFTQEANDLLQAAQEKADVGKTWGEALESAGVTFKRVNLFEVA